MYTTVPHLFVHLNKQAHLIHSTGSYLQLFDVTETEIKIDTLGGKVK